MRLLCLILGLACASVATAAVPPARLEKLTRGVNLSHWFSQIHHFDGTYHVEWLRTYNTPADFRLIAGAGFRHVRFPVELEMFQNPAAPGKLNLVHLAEFDRALAGLLDAGLAVIVDWHAREDTKHALATDAAAADLAVATWQALARHLAGSDPERVFLELMNEPAGGMSFAHWDALQRRLAVAVRAEAPQHTLIITGHRWSGIDELLQLKPYPDANVVYNFHFYEPMVFTHQAAAWPDMGLEPLKGVRYPMDPANKEQALAQVGDGKGRRHVLEYTADRAWIARRFDEVSAWAKQHGVAVTCNEFGVYRPVSPPADRLAWLRDVVQELDARGIGWSMWDYAGGFAVALGDSPQRRIDAEVVQALGLSR
jgi:aryl-phospho-beta-D-glucosidase BglC (GH1 family)